MNYQKFIIVIFFLSAFGASAALADTLPVITAFTASASNIAHGYGITFTWTPPADNFSGTNFYFTCPAGVTILNAAGSAFPCNIYGTTGSAVTYTGAAFYVKNVSGSTQTVYAKIVPKDYSGAENTAGALQTSFTVTTVARPITDFTVSASPIPLGTNVTLSWTGFDIPGANLQFDCVPGLHVTSVSPASTGDLPCGTAAYASDLAASGSAIWSFTNDLTQTAKLNMYVLPAITLRTYDSAHGLSLARDVAAKADKPVATVTSFTASAERVASGATVTFSWGASNVAGGNLQAQCSDGVTMTGIDSSATTTPAKMPCNRLLFSSARAATSSVALTFTNTSGIAEQVGVTFLPQNSDGTYDATKGKTITISVSPPVATAPSTATTTAAAMPSVAVSAPAVSAPATAVTSIVRTFTFTAPLYFGLRGSAVTELQKFLAQDKTLYPEGLM
ncbi:MAG: hypothetical protein HZA25_00955, partial [Candidatus Niyogibacteria bacterium]|nr:hypothetical protein [Candidatus Niyogibacteria bacterium]